MATHMAPVTPIESHPDLAKAIGASGVIFKREDLHPYGSHKGRSLPIMVEHYARAGDRRFAISSSGNAALAAALSVREHNSKTAESLSLDIFIGNRISRTKAEKLHALADINIRVLTKERPKQALTEAMNEGARSLRQSLDDMALEGYSSLAEEIMSQAKKAGAVFVGTSSGTTAQALAEYFNEKNADIQVHIVQTSSCHPMSQEFEPYDGPDEQSLADAITDIVGHRKEAVITSVNESGGRGWTATNDEIELAQKLVSKHAGLEISTNSALSIVGLMKAVEIGWEFSGSAVCLICGD